MEREKLEQLKIQTGSWIQLLLGETLECNLLGLTALLSCLRLVGALQ